ncbi:MAG: hypothetical protein OXF31_13295, partial [Gammaproteobacteria bacterium]|nr:hypothetical protein [Gammaproteobacteria bacterium]
MSRGDRQQQQRSQTRGQDAEGEALPTEERKATSHRDALYLKRTHNQPRSAVCGLRSAVCGLRSAV